MAIYETAYYMSNFTVCQAWLRWFLGSENSGKISGTLLILIFFNNSNYFDL